jgi:hypothetical protein
MKILLLNKYSVLYADTKTQNSKIVVTCYNRSAVRGSASSACGQCQAASVRRTSHTSASHNTGSRGGREEAGTSITILRLQQQQRFVMYRSLKAVLLLCCFRTAQSSMHQDLRLYLRCNRILPPQHKWAAPVS